MKKANFRIKKIMNNNIILAYDLVRRNEKIMLGKGLGFNRVEGAKVYISDDEIQKAFTAEEKKMRREYFKLVEKTDDMIIAVCEKIIGEAEDQLGELDSYIHILLTDHISFAIERVKSGMKIDNPLNEEIRALYPKEFELALEGVRKIRRYLGVNLGEGEAGFIAIHINSARNNRKVKDTVKNTRVIKEIVELIQQELDINIDKTQYNYSRLVSHIYGTIQRVKSGKTIENPLLPNIKEKFSISFDIVKKIEKIIKEEHEVDIPEGELGYLVIHIERLREK